MESVASINDVDIEQEPDSLESELALEVNKPHPIVQRREERFRASIDARLSLVRNTDE